MYVCAIIILSYYYTYVNAQVLTYIHKFRLVIYHDPDRDTGFNAIKKLSELVYCACDILKECS